MDLLKIAAVVSALKGTEGAPESTLYMFNNMNMDAHMSLMATLQRANLIENKGHWVKLTARGEALAKSIDETLAANAAKKEASKS